jgi:phage terminase large subunit
VLFGGAAGGSKSHALRWHAYLSCLRTPGYKALMLRRTYKDLERTHLREAEMEASTFGATALISAKVVRFPNGSILEFGHCEDSSAVANYLSAEYDLIEFDELVTFEHQQFLMIASRARTRKEGIRPRVLAGTNPGGPQAHWVRAMFIDKTVDAAEFPNYKPDEYAYIPSKLEDNPYLNEDYEQGLLDLPLELRKAYRDGDWDIFPGQYFPEWRRGSHVSHDHVSYPSDFPRVRAVDWGFVKPGWCGWFVMLPDGQSYLEDEYVFTRTIASDVAKEIDRRTKARGIKVRYTVGDTAMWTPDAQTGESISETFARFHVPMIQSDKDRLNGWARLRHWLRASPSGQPWLMASPECRYYNRTIPSLVSDEHKPEDVDSDGEDHAADAVRYFCMSRPMPGSQKKAAENKTGTWAWWKAQGQSQATGILGGRT